MNCPNCNTKADSLADVCEACGTEIVSVPDDKMDALVSAASIPNLASLFRAGKDKGLIKPTSVYGE